MPPAAGHPRAVVAGIGGQQLLQHAAARMEHPRADHRLGSLQAGAAAAQRSRRVRRQAAYLRGFLPRERLEEPLMSVNGSAIRQTRCLVAAGR